MSSSRVMDIMTRQPRSHTSTAVMALVGGEEERVMDIMLRSSRMISSWRHSLSTGWDIRNESQAMRARRQEGR